jgi:hypothetical protein
METGSIEMSRNVLVNFALSVAIVVAWSPPVSNAEEPAAATPKSKSRSPAELLELAGPGPEHERLARLKGDWSVKLQMPPTNPSVTIEGNAATRSILGDRFLIIEGTVGQGEQATSMHYTLGFDRRHDEYTIVALDTYGTYFVTARGPAGEERHVMFGEDNDPVMTEMGLKKKFAFVLQVADDDHFSVEIDFVDTRTPEEKLIPFAKYEFTRGG